MIEKFFEKFFFASLKVLFETNSTHLSIHPWDVSVKIYEHFKFDDTSVILLPVIGKGAYNSLKDAQDKTDI